MSDFIYTYKNLGKLGRGRLGNQLWQIAWMIGQAEGDPSRFQVDPDWSYREFFSLPDEAYEPKDGPAIDGEHWYQELKWWQDFQYLVWEWLQPSFDTWSYLKDSYPSWVYNQDVPKCSIHYRRGDYLTNPHMFPTLPDSYYEEGIHRILLEDPHTQFLVFSDDFKFIEGKYRDRENFYCVQGVTTAIDPANQVGAPQDQFDLFTQSECGDHVIANSSFSWWSAFLSASGRAFYPSIWWGQGLNATDSEGRLIRDTWREGMFPNWEEISC